MQSRLRFAGELEGLELGRDGEGEEAEQDPAQCRDADPFQDPLAGCRERGRCAALRSGRRGGFFEPLPQAREVRFTEPGEEPPAGLVDLVIGRSGRPLLIALGHERLRNDADARGRPRNPDEPRRVDRRRSRRHEDAGRSPRQRLRGAVGEPRGLDRPDRGGAGRAAGPRGRRGAGSSCRASAAIGIGIPATIDHERGVAVSAVNLPIEDLPLRDLVAERTGLPAFVDNDANVAALAEFLYGAAKGAQNVVMLTIGTGIGGGLILGGELYRGSTGAGAELGHFTIEIDGPRCQGNCPNHGCVETMASGTAIGREGRAAARTRAGLRPRRAARRGPRDRRQGGDRGGATPATRPRSTSSN